MTISTMITSIVLISAIAAALALLLEAAYARIADYGQVHILINEEKNLEVRGGDPLLATLIESKIFIPSACGGKGTCGYCKVNVDEGGGPMLPTETPFLSEEELARNTRISCQIKVKSDMKVNIPPELFRVREFRVLAELIEDMTPVIKFVRLKIMDPEEGLSFVPGQYIQLQIPAYKFSSIPEFRAYSIASSHRDYNHIELIIGRVEEGVVSTYVHDYLEEGNELLARGPFGDFRLLEADRDILLIATGTGLAPILSILDQIEHEHIKRKTTLLFGSKRPEDLLYYDRLKSLEQRLPNFTFIPVLSRVKEADNWKGETGRVTDLIKKYIADNAPADVHICGLPAMVESCVELLIQKGIPADRIVYDKFE
jgi:Na+-transporting NADH:ubiquinone oxidoreductase subunit F